jgi:hypothetical protein
MKHSALLLATLLGAAAPASAGVTAGAPYSPEYNPGFVLEPFTYTQDFETRAECAWASYPQWQDTAYDPNFRANTIVPGDPNISIVQCVTPYTNVDNYSGAMKELDAWLAPGGTISLRYYLKTELKPEFFKVRLAAGPDGKLDVTFPCPPTNRWEWVTVAFGDFVRENPKIAGKDRIKVNALAVLAKFPGGDPSMPIYMGLDDIAFKGARTMAFQFAEPQVFKLPDWNPYIPKKHYKKGDLFTLRGSWPLGADRVDLRVISYTDTAKTVLTSPLKLAGNEWSLAGYKLLWPEGLYLATLTAYKGAAPLSETRFTLYIAPATLGGNHPRLWYDAEKKKWVDSRLKTDKFKKILDGILASAKSAREGGPVDKIVFDIDQFPDENWIATLTSWSSARIHTWENAWYQNALAYSLGGDREAGEYAKNLLVKISTFPYVLHPWMIKRGHHIYYPVGEMGMMMALAYDLTYDLMSENERKVIRDGMMRFIVKACHQGYVVDDLVISNTSNWVAHITGGSIMCMAAMYGDSPDMTPLEPYFTGAIMKDHDLIQKTLDRDGDYGEGKGYFDFSMLSWSKSLPALENVFKVDISSKLNGGYKGLIWEGSFIEREHFYFGDSGGGIGPMTSYAWMLPKYKDPLLGYMYNTLKSGDSFMDVLYETTDVPQKDPFDQNPVKLFKDTGTTVFKSGWGKDDFIFVLRTGPFVNHQHIDQGTFWLKDRGSLFFEERHGSTYYDDPNYQPWYTQPVAHSTILVDDNHQSQRVGDLLWHVDGFNDYAYVWQFLDGKKAAFVSGDIGRLYWGKVKSLKRNVLYLKPRTLLMLDTAVPAEKDADITLLYQTRSLADIKAGSDVSTITKGGNTLFIRHLSPSFVEARPVETPHYLYTLRNNNPLEREGMLTVKARTNGVPLVMANLLTSTTGAQPNLTAVEGTNCVSGSADGVPFVYSTRPGTIYTADGITTDAAAVTGDSTDTFAALCTTFSRGSTLLMEADNPVTFEATSAGFTYNTCRDCTLTLGAASKPASVTLNGKAVPFAWNSDKSAVVLGITKGDGVVVVK